MWSLHALGLLPGLQISLSPKELKFTFYRLKSKHSVTLVFQAYTCSHYTCPICGKSLGDMGVSWSPSLERVICKSRNFKYHLLNFISFVSFVNSTGLFRYAWCTVSCRRTSRRIQKSLSGEKTLNLLFLLLLSFDDTHRHTHNCSGHPM